MVVPNPDGLSVTESWNGSSWTELNDLATSRYGLGGSTNGGAGSALAFGGFPGPKNNTEEFTANLANKTITSS